MLVNYSGEIKEIKKFGVEISDINYIYALPPVDHWVKWTNLRLDLSKEQLEKLREENDVYIPGSNCLTYIPEDLKVKFDKFRSLVSRNSVGIFKRIRGSYIKAFKEKDDSSENNQSSYKIMYGIKRKNNGTTYIGLPCRIERDIYQRTNIQWDLENFELIYNNDS